MSKEAIKSGVWKCPECGGRRFKIVTQQVVSDVANRENDRPWEYTDATIEKDDILEVRCLKCGRRLFTKTMKKPISKKAWDEFWNEHITTFIMGFDSYVVNRELEGEDVFEAFIEGMAKGMWALYNFIEAELVEGK